MKKWWIILVAIMAMACKKENELIDEVPQLELISIAPQSVVQFQDSVIIRLSYQDGNGDLGGFPADSTNLYVVDTRNNVPFEFRIQELVPGGQEVPVKGTLKVMIQNLYLTGNSSKESVTFDIYAYDRAGHKSNVLRTPAIVVHQ